jgi:hypothetical protein
MPSQLVYMPMIKKGMFARQTRGMRRGKGIGAVLLDGGMGGQSSYSSVDDYERTTGIDIRGAGRKMDMSRMSKKLENLMIKPTSRKIKNINFSI